MPGNKKPNRKPKKKRPPQKQITYGAGANAPDDDSAGKAGSRGEGGHSSGGPARVSRGSARGG
ncbi:MAG: hypothetical protein VW268_04615 [Rhodospirillaceae bacterium]